MNAAPPAAPHIGVFDSGIGGLSVLRCLRRELPQCTVSYLADNRHLPYGAKPPSWLVERCGKLTQQLLNRGAGLVLVACNTATTHTIAALRARWPDVPFVGVEPGIKPAIATSRRGRIAVIATEATLQSPRLRSLIDDHGRRAEVRLQPCPGLADAVDAANDAAIDALVGEACAEIVAAEVDTVVLGCTHYPLIAERFARRLGPDVALIDTADAVCRRVRALLPATSDAPTLGRGALSIEATGGVEGVQRAVERWLGEAVQVVQSDL
jgi:glutamate racemase